MTRRTAPGMAAAMLNDEGFGWIRELLLENECGE